MAYSGYTPGWWGAKNYGGWGSPYSGLSGGNVPGPPPAFTGGTGNTWGALPASAGGASGSIGPQGGWSAVSPGTYNVYDPNNAAAMGQAMNYAYTGQGSNPFQATVAPGQFYGIGNNQIYDQQAGIVMPYQGLQGMMGLGSTAPPYSSIPSLVGGGTSSTSPSSGTSSQAAMPPPPPPIPSIFNVGLDSMTPRTISRDVTINRPNYTLPGVGTAQNLTFAGSSAGQMPYTDANSVIPGAYQGSLDQIANVALPGYDPNSITKYHQDLLNQLGKESLGIA